ncbi:DDE-1 domain containing protein [Pyrenophora tritici-repentis]|uniref:DDE-1 domain containing protein n=1 Tax=Pyrenophora tritici-repentis TaxID=45151 RepID=A0A922N909_9PLEO|nr:DDE-1 domain containing protein [Pyrenophora tritici-repentis]
MIQNFGSAVAKWDVSRSWASRFLHRHADKITTKWSAGIDRNRLQADSGDKCKLYFDLLHAKMQEYNVEERDIYNMDEKGFFVGRTIRSKRIFSKASLAQKERTAALQDSNREWVTLLACVCTSGEALPPALIYQGTSGVQSSWIDDDEAEQHQVFVSHSPSGWTNNDLGLAWLTQVLNRYTKAKARRRWRLLLLDGHGSHVTADFIDFCDANRILLALFPPPPPHSTHSLQSLDVVLFSPLSRNYTTELNRNSQRSQGLTSVTKRDFYSNFWAT